MGPGGSGFEDVLTGQKGCLYSVGKQNVYISNLLPSQLFLKIPGYLWLEAMGVAGN